MNPNSTHSSSVHTYNVSLTGSRLIEYVIYHSDEFLKILACNATDEHLVMILGINRLPLKVIP